MKKLVYGVGTNDVPLSKRERIRYAWKSMLGRCYSARRLAKHPTYAGCSVCKEWQTLSNFIEWASPHWEPGLQLDKDILIPGNKLYAPDRCIFVTPQLNTLLNEREGARGSYPIGVTLLGCGQFQVRVSQKGMAVDLGRFDRLEEARRVYVKAKATHIRNVAAEQANFQVRIGLEEHARRLEATVQSPSIAPG